MAKEEEFIPIYEEYDIMGKKVQIHVGYKVIQCDAYYEALEREDAFAAHMWFMPAPLPDLKHIQRQIDFESKIRMMELEQERFEKMSPEMQEIELAAKMGISLDKMRGTDRRPFIAKLLGLPKEWYYEK
jgi:hypothetical protein